MRVTATDLAALKRKAEQPVLAEGEVLAVFVRGKLVNTKNARLHHMAEYRYKRNWKDAVAMALFEVGFIPIAGAKHVRIMCSTAKAMDSQDGLRVACAPIVDALGEFGVLTGRLERAGRGDEDERGHVFEYHQKIDKRRGVEIRVRPL